MRYLAPFHYFKAVAKTGSVRGAAEGLAITPSALNRRIQDFEAEVGMPLFDRSHEGLSLNAAGELVMRFVQNQDFEMSKLHAQLHDLQGLKRGHLRFACTQAIIASSLPSTLLEFRRSHPFVTFDIRTLRGNQEEVWLQEKEIEFAICLGRKRPHQFESLLSYPAQVGILIPEGHHLYEEEAIKLGQLISETLSVPKSDFRLREILERGFLAKIMPFKPVVETDDFSLLNRLAQINCSLSFRLIQPWDQSSPQEGARLIPIAKTDLPPVEIQILKAREAHISPLAEAFCQKLEMLFSEGE